ncbi:eukaryotic translation initiation factor 2 subunit beta [Vairimorpha necatrix]|uniref:Eukaryotic translation initiation factor 2 subunit beta n=1 Tax=Vairimorpha necatrix TaxID=6039 RepID=A0AAX4JBP3_9MICR
MSDSSSSEIEELGINLKEFSMKRQTRLGSRKTTQSTKQEDDLIDTPTELQYYTLLKNAMSILKKDKEDRSSNKLRLPLEVKREGIRTKVNIVEIADILDREVFHITKFITSELMAEGSVKDDGYLWIKGNFLKAKIQEVLRKFIENFVVCKSCDGIEDTAIIKEQRLFYLQCNKCGGRHCVGNDIDGLSSKSGVKPKLRGII